METAILYWRVRATILDICVTTCALFFLLITTTQRRMELFAIYLVICSLTYKSIQMLNKESNNIWNMNNSLKLFECVPNDEFGQIYTPSMYDSRTNKLANWKQQPRMVAAVKKRATKEETKNKRINSAECECSAFCSTKLKLGPVKPVFELCASFFSNTWTRCSKYKTIAFWS